MRIGRIIAVGTLAAGAYRAYRLRQDKSQLGSDRSSVTDMLKRRSR